ncbi:chalcone isomerase family protein [Tundrisphaera lichenicola]|uniref:chalcone isomerase family protein n=1 Tax=Tundrisphaera lichenicola TaxID=2029860 RepID=UPI003EB95D37
MQGKGCLAIVLLGLSTPSMAADRDVVVGSTKYPTSITAQCGGKPVRMVLTGTAMRTRWTLSVYSIASYVQEKAAVRSPGDLAGTTAAKQLVLSFERAIDGSTMAASFRDSIGMNHPAPAFSKELDALAYYMGKHPVKPGDQVRLTAIPGVGLSCQVVGAPEVMIRNVAFSRAVWDVYLGRKNLGVAIQTGLTSRLVR